MNIVQVVAIAGVLYMAISGSPTPGWQAKGTIGAAVCFALGALFRSSDGEWLPAVVDAELAIACAYLAWLNGTRSATVEEAA